MAIKYKSKNQDNWDGQEMFDLLTKLRAEGQDLEDVEISSMYEASEIEVEWTVEETPEEEAERLKCEFSARVSRAEAEIERLRGALPRAVRRLADIKEGKMPF